MIFTRLKYPTQAPKIQLGVAHPFRQCPFKFFLYFLFAFPCPVEYGWPNRLRLNFWENVCKLLCRNIQKVNNKKVSGVTCQVSHIECHFFCRPGRSQGLLYKHHRNSLIDWLIKLAIIRENIFTAPPHPSHKIDYVKIFQEILNPEENPNRITGSKVAAILLNGWILLISGASSGRVCACSLCSRLVFILLLFWTARVCYQRSIPCLVYSDLQSISKKINFKEIPTIFGT